MPQHPNQSLAIENLQRYLRQLSYDHPEIPAPPIDGVFESQTKDALNAFQQLYGIPVRESIDQAAWETLYTAYLLSLEKSSAPKSVVIFPRVPTGTALSVGAVGFPVAAVQYMLRELSARYSDVAFPEASGYYDEETARAVREFQKRNNLATTGEVDKATWDAIVSQHNTMSERYSHE